MCVCVCVCVCVLKYRCTWIQLLHSGGSVLVSIPEEDRCLSCVMSCMWRTREVILCCVRPSCVCVCLCVCVCVCVFFTIVILVICLQESCGPGAWRWPSTCCTSWEPSRSRSSGPGTGWVARDAGGSHVHRYSKWRTTKWNWGGSWKHPCLNWVIFGMQHFPIKKKNTTFQYCWCFRRILFIQVCVMNMGLKYWCRHRRVSEILRPT